MKKFLVVLVVLAISCFSAVAFAVDVSVDGSIEIRSRDFQDLTGNKDLTNNQVDTQERVRIGVNAKAGDNLKGRVQIENDWDDWGRLEAPQGNGQTAPGWSANPNNGRLDIREAWIDFMLPDLPVGVKGGHQLLQLGQGWFFRSMKYGSDAWLAYWGSGNNTLAGVNVKVAENSPALANDDIDAYVLLDVYKIDDKNTVGIDLTDVNFRNPGRVVGADGNDLYNIGLNYTGDLGVVKLKGEADIQTGSDKTTPGAEHKYKGYQVVAQGVIPVNDLSLNATLAYGSGHKAGSADNDQIITILDMDQHYTFLYEYKVATADGATHTGFANTEAVNVGAGYKVSKSFDAALNLWYLMAVEKTNVPIAGLPGGSTSDKIGWEADLALNWKLYDNLTWNWQLGYFKPGDMYKNAAGQGDDAITGIQGVLAFKF